MPNICILINNKHKTNIMKKSMFNSFNVDDAVQNGINEFGRLSGYKIYNATTPKIEKQKKRAISKRLPIIVVAFFLKLLK